MRGSGTGADLEREARGTEERRVGGVENGLNLLLLDGEQVLLRFRTRVGVFFQKVLEENDARYSTLRSVSRRDFAAAALPWDGLDRVISAALESRQGTTARRHRSKVAGGGAPPLRRHDCFSLSLPVTRSGGFEVRGFRFWSGPDWWTFILTCGLNGSGP